METLITKKKLFSFENIVLLFWQITVFASFWGTGLFAVDIPRLGFTLFLFRIAVPCTFLVLVIYYLKNKINPFKGLSSAQKVFLLYIAVMTIYGIVSLFVAINPRHTFSVFINQTFVVFFGLLFTFIVNNKARLKATIINVAANLFLLVMVGYYEAFTGGIWTNFYSQYKAFSFFDLKFLTQPTAVFENTNDFLTVLIFAFAMILIPTLIYMAKNKENKKVQWLCGGYLTFILSSLLFFSEVSFARLATITLWVILFAIVLYILIWRRKLILIPIIVFVCMAVFWVMPRYTQIVVHAENLVDEIAYNVKSFTNSNDKPAEPAKRPIPQIYGQHKPEDEGKENYVDPNDPIYGSNKTRIELFKFGTRVVIKTKGVGAGLGNSEVLAADLGLWLNKSIANLHCYPLRLVADYGLFILIPMLWLYLLLFIYGVRNLKLYRKTHDQEHLIIGFFMFFMMVVGIMLATIPADAQNINAMWLFLCGIICLTKIYPIDKMHKKHIAENSLNLDSTDQTDGTKEDLSVID